MIFGSFTIDLAIMILYLYPPDKFYPLSAKIVWYPFGNSYIKSWQLAILAAFCTDSIDVSNP